VVYSFQQDTPTSIGETQVVAYASTPREEEQGEIFMVVEEEPVYPGGMEELMKFLQKNIRYPKEAMEQNKQGRVIVQFVVNKDGSISEATVVRSVDTYLDAEALRVVNAMPNWTPGKQKGEPVRVRFTLPLMFRLQ
jgi:protein TonB